MSWPGRRASHAKEALRLGPRRSPSVRWPVVIAAPPAGDPRARRGPPVPFAALRRKMDCQWPMLPAALRCLFRGCGCTYAAGMVRIGRQGVISKEDCAYTCISMISMVIRTELRVQQRFQTWAVCFVSALVRWPSRDLISGIKTSAFNLEVPRL